MGFARWTAVCGDAVGIFRPLRFAAVGHHGRALAARRVEWHFCVLVGTKSRATVQVACRAADIGDEARRSSGTWHRWRCGRTASPCVPGQPTWHTVPLVISVRQSSGKQDRFVSRYVVRLSPAPFEVPKAETAARFSLSHPSFDVWARKYARVPSPSGKGDQPSHSRQLSYQLVVFRFPSSLRIRAICFFSCGTRRGPRAHCGATIPGLRHCTMPGSLNRSAV
jgi:hypothetical protein